MGEDRPLQVLQLGVRLEPELVAEQRAPGLIRIEGVRLTPGAIQSEHELCTKPLPERVRAD